MLWAHQVPHLWKLKDLILEQTTSVYTFNLCSSPFRSHLFLCPLANGFAFFLFFFPTKTLSSLGNDWFYFACCFLCLCYEMSLREKKLTPESREALSSWAANILSLQYKVKRPKLQVKHLQPYCVLLSDMQVMQQQEVCAINEHDLKTVCCKATAEAWLRLPA